MAILSTSMAAAAVVAALAAGGVMMNEGTHGGLSESMGLGHYHMADYGGFHCASHADAMHGAQHVQHMHNETHAPHSNCNGGAGMHGMNATQGGMRNG